MVVPQLNTPLMMELRVSIVIFGGDKFYMGNLFPTAR